MSIKQVIVVRKDLNMRKGKLAAQVAHASIKALIGDDMWLSGGGWRPGIDLDEIREKWLLGESTKIVVGVDSEKELMNLYIDAQLAKVRHALIRDAGRTEFKEPTYTALAVGPAKEDEVDKITGHLKLI